MSALAKAEHCPECGHLPYENIDGRCYEELNEALCGCKAPYHGAKGPVNAPSGVGPSRRKDEEIMAEIKDLRVTNGVLHLSVVTTERMIELYDAEDRAESLHEQLRQRWCLTCFALVTIPKGQEANSLGSILHTDGKGGTHGKLVGPEEMLHEYAAMRGQRDFARRELDTLRARLVAMETASQPDEPEQEDEAPLSAEMRAFTKAAREAVRDGSSVFLTGSGSFEGSKEYIPSVYIVSPAAWEGIAALRDLQSRPADITKGQEMPGYSEEEAQKALRSVVATATRKLRNGESLAMTLQVLSWSSFGIGRLSWRSEEAKARETRPMDPDND